MTFNGGVNVIVQTGSNPVALRTNSPPHGYIFVILDNEHELREVSLQFRDDVRQSSLCLCHDGPGGVGHHDVRHC